MRARSAVTTSSSNQHLEIQREPLRTSDKAGGPSRAHHARRSAACPRPGGPVATCPTHGVSFAGSSQPINAQHCRVVLELPAGCGENVFGEFADHFTRMSIGCPLEQLGYDDVHGVPLEKTIGHD